MWLQNLNKRQTIDTLSNEGMSLNQARELVEESDSNGYASDTACGKEYKVFPAHPGLYDIKSK